MMKLKIEIGILRKFLEQFIHSTNELKLCVKEDGISYIVVDQAHIMINSSRLRKEAFVYYAPEEIDEFGIDISKCIQVLKLGKSKNHVTITDDDNKLYFDFGIKTECSKIDVTEFQNPKTPTIDFINYAIVEKSMIEPVINHCKKNLGDYFLLDMNEFGIRIYSSNGIEKLDYPISKSKILEYFYKGPSTTMYSLEYFSMILKYLPDKNIKISMALGNSCPIKIEYDNADMEGLTLLAPRIEDDDDIISSLPELKHEDYNPNNDDIW
jgi:hypothetical protein